MNRDLPDDPAEATTMPIERPTAREGASTAESPTVDTTRAAAAPTVEIRTARTVRGSGPRCPGCDAENPGVPVCPACGLDLTDKWVALPPAEGAADRFEADLGAVCLVTDRGIAHARNEDAVAAAVVEGEHGPHTTVIVVCDGVSTSSDPQAASGSAVRAGVRACLRALERGLPATEAAVEGLSAASEAVRSIPTEEHNAPSCTYVSAIVRGAGGGAVDITVANVGDSRAYWLAAPGAEQTGIPSQRLTVDDSWAQALVDAGAMDEQAAMNDPRAHTLLRWLGADTDERPWSDKAVRTFRADTPGRLLLCSDGLWNYRPDAEQLAAIAAAGDPMA
ncbi:MAG TPA: protein phosphatase 2C domain-containing protein, partial [Nocardia sp.]|uniref:PP2C family protein-serine/threonine phosphatase n=1 Tax=Nocardia sp. TaxID=1821 RepID=UPI002B4AD356